MPETGAPALSVVFGSPSETIRRKRDGLALPDAEIASFISAFARGEVSGEQAAALAMAVYFQGMDGRECAGLTRAMVASGRLLDWSRQDLAGPVLDKHSTGGVGDNVSLILAPALAACGAFVPMISGRGLGHSGGTLDKLEAIPGYRTTLAIPDLQEAVSKLGCVIVGASADLAPADAKLYAIRDVTATVDSIPLITSSILSKKAAEGLDGLVMDVKSGSGAFMAQIGKVRELADSLVAVAEAVGLRIAALITDMDQPLASAAGNAVELRHALDHLAGRRREARVHAVTVALGGALLALGGLAADEAEGRRRIETAIEGGAAAERFGAMVHGLGGPGDLLERWEHILPDAPVRRTVEAQQRGIVEGVDTRAVGLAVVALGGGRNRPADRVDPRVGFTELAPLGADVGPGVTPLGMIHAASEADADHAAARLLAAYRIGGERYPPRDPVIARIGRGAPA